MNLQKILQTTPVQLFKDVRETFSDSYLLYESFLNGGNYKNLILQLRKEDYHSERYNYLKKMLPVGLTGGFSHIRRKRTKDIDIVYNIATVDIDYADNESIFKENSIEDVKRFIFERVPYCFCCMRSCGGRGLVLYLLLKNLTVLNEKAFFRYIQKTLNEVTQINIAADRQASNLISRVRFISYDDNILLRYEAEPLELPSSYEVKSYETLKLEGIKNNIVTTPTEFEVNDIEDIQYLNSTRRYQYCYTLKCFFSKEETEALVTKIYDAYHHKSPNSDKNEAYKHIHDSCNYDTQYVVPSIKNELILLGILRDENNPHIELKLKEGEYLSDRMDFVLNNFKSGYNMLISGTGTGKTELWKKVAQKHKVMIIEPYGSVIDNKYDDSFFKAKGSGVHITNEGVVVSNYYHFAEDSKAEFGEFDYLVIDESHLLGMQAYRGESLCFFISSVKEYCGRYPNCKIILQTASPSNESHFFDIEREIEVSKFVDKNITLSFKCAVSSSTKREYKYDILNHIFHLTKKYVGMGRKVFIYWGSGSLDIMKCYQESQEYLTDFKVAIYHKKNEGIQDTEYIKEHSKMGRYEVLITSCYFSVGCDLNDTDPASIIIIGNNPYQEDEQVIGRFRKSKDITVDFLMERVSGIPKRDCNRLLEVCKFGLEHIEETKNLRTNTLIAKSCSTENIDDFAYMCVAAEYFSDIARKFDWYKEKGYRLNNTYTLELKKDYSSPKTPYRLLYDIYTNGCEFPLVELIEDHREFVKEIRKKNRESIEEQKMDVIEELKNDPTLKIRDMLQENVSKPRLHDWLEAMDVIQSHYDLSTFFERVPLEDILEMSKKAISPVCALKIKLDNNHIDEIELSLIRELIRYYEGLDDKLKFNIEYMVVLAYVKWVKYCNPSVHYVYDLKRERDIYEYPVFKAWKEKVLSVIRCNANVRDYLLFYNDSLTDIAVSIFEDSKYDYLPVRKLDSIFVEDYVNKYYHDSQGGKFIVDMFKYLNERYKIETDDISETLEVIKKVRSETRKTNSSLGGKSSKKSNSKKVEIEGVLYDSVAQAAKSLGISRHQVRKLLCSNELTQ